MGAFSRRGLAGAAATAALGAALTTPAAAAPPPLVSLASSSFSVASAKDRSCDSRALSGSGVVSRSLTAPGTGWVSARLDGSSGDWDLAIFGRGGRLVAASTAFGADEVAEGIAAKGERLRVQACRRTGRGAGARLRVSSRAFDTSRKPEPISTVRVATPNPARKRELTSLGLDLTEHGGKGFVEVVLHGAADARKLRKHRFVYTTEVRNLLKQEQSFRARDASFARRVRASALPSGRTTYRRLNDYTNDMKRLASQNPGIVKPITLPFKTWTGRTVEGIEITENAGARDGKPVFLNMGAHHAREWPSAEHSMEWAFELVNGWRRGDARTRRLMRSTRTIVVPVINPEGFNTSREAGQALGFGGGRPGNDTTDTAFFASQPYEYQRKNCRVNNPDGADPARGDCMQLPAQGLTQFGVDPNRNYGGFWGGPGASADGPPPGGDFAQDYRGGAPFSEPETRNVRALVSRRQVTTLITNHTYSNLLLRPPGIQVQGPPPDEGIYKALGDSMARDNGYASQRSYQLYDTTGGTEDWTYYATGGLGFTFEIGPNGFHPSFADNVAEYEGTTGAARALRGGGNRAAYFKALEHTADSSKHSVISGKGPAGGVIRLRKNFQTSTSPVIDSAGVEGKPILFGDELNSVMAVPDGGSFNWHVNPSTRPVVAKQKGRAATGRPSAPVNDLGNPPPGAPCGAAAPLPACYRDHAFTVPQGAGIDNAKATVKVNWASPASDYDVTIYRDTNNDGTSNGEPDSAIVGSSASGTTAEESATFGEPAEVIKGRRYVIRVLNYAGGETYDVRISFGGPDPFVPAKRENWTLTCEVPEGRVVMRRQVFVARGENRRVDLRACVARACIANASGRVRGSTLGRARLNRKRRAQRRILKGRLVSRRGGFDRYCVRGGGAMRIGYPLKRLRRKLSKRLSRRVNGRAVVILTSNRRYRIRGIRKGTGVRALKRRLKGEKTFKIGRNRWYVANGKRARVVFKVQRRRVQEVGLLDKRLSGTKRAQKRTLRSWELRR